MMIMWVGLRHTDDDLPEDSLLNGELRRRNRDLAVRLDRAWECSSRRFP